MYTPIFKKGTGHYILLDGDYVSQHQEQAMAYGIVGQMLLIDLNYSFTGECFLVRDDAQLFIAKETLPRTGQRVELGLIGGEAFDSAKEGKQSAEYVFTPDKFFDDNLFIVEIIEMNDNSNMTVAIGYDKDTYDPYVLLMGMSEEEPITPNKAREVATHLVYAAEASEMDSFIRRALNSAYGDDEMSQDKKNQLIDAIRNLREQSREEAKENQQEELDTD